MSRRFTVANVPDPGNLKAKFVYNFFVSDERINSDGDPRVKGGGESLQKLITRGALDFQVPRYVDVQFDDVKLKNAFMVNAGVGNDLDILKNASSEETITNVGFSSLRETDESALPRLKQKVDALSKILGLSFESSFQSKKIAEKMGVEQSAVQTILSPLGDKSVLLVNGVQPPVSENVFQVASNLRIQSQINKRLMGAITNAADDTSPLSKNEIINDADDISSAFIKLSSANNLLLSDIEPSFKTISTPIPVENSETKIIGAEVIGYIVTRHQFSEDGAKIETKDFTLLGAINNRLIDSQVLYGTTYSYEARAVIRIDAIIEADVEEFAINGSQKTKWRISTAIASRPSPAARVRTEEFVAPNQPDGVMYKFNYDKGRGLNISWQIPSGRSRDVKYFQIFRRKTIFEPFVCIGMIDFDNSIVRTPQREFVRPDVIIKKELVQTYFEDKFFGRNDKYIYAISAVDAHGFSSGYSVQTEIGFDVIRNEITQKYISQGGAPKQYPNFYVDPRMDDNISVDSFTQDAIFDSGHKKMVIYFTPDARQISDANGNIENVFYTTDAGKGSSNAGYHIHFINVDLQKSTSTIFRIADNRDGK